MSSFASSAIELTKEELLALGANEADLNSVFVLFNFYIRPFVH
jgi:hypothetical protein